MVGRLTRARRAISVIVVRSTPYARMHAAAASRMRCSTLASDLRIDDMCNTVTHDAPGCRADHEPAPDEVERMGRPARGEIAEFGHPRVAGASAGRDGYRGARARGRRGAAATVGAVEDRPRRFYRHRRLG